MAAIPGARAGAARPVPSAVAGRAADAVLATTYRGPGAAPSTAGARTRCCTCSPSASASARWSGPGHAVVGAGRGELPAVHRPGVAGGRGRADRGEGVAYPAYSRFKWSKVFWGVTATPVTPGEVCDGEVLFVGTRLLAASLLYYLVVVFGVARSARPADDPVRRCSPGSRSRLRSWRSAPPCTRRRRVRDGLPVRRGADRPVLRIVLPDHPAAAGCAGGLPIAALARELAVPGAPHGGSLAGAIDAAYLAVSRAGLLARRLYHRRLIV